MTLEELYKNYRDEAAQYASLYGIDMNSMEGDAFLHAYTSASITGQYGSVVAELAGYIMELIGFLNGHSLGSINMDLWNDNVGREIGLSSTSKDEMAQQVFDALNMGNLITNEVNEPRNYFEDYPDLNNTFYGDEGDNSITTGSGFDTVYGEEGNDTIMTGSGNDTVYGGEGDDTINTGYGHDSINGDAGNDKLYGGAGNDTYRFNIGDGMDQIFDYSISENNNGGNDTVKFGIGIGISDVVIYKNGDDLILSYGNDDLITITNQFTANNAIESFTLSDGNYLTSNDINVIIESMDVYATDHGIIIDSIGSVQANQDLMNIISSGWHNFG